mgnify:CR=1 FL=1
MKVDNEGGAASALHVSPTVAARPGVSVENASGILDTDAGSLPGARGTDGMVAGRETNSVGSGKLEH